MSYIAEDRGFESPCWIWQRHINSDGYGKLGHSKGLAHRVAYEDIHGPLAPGLELDHLCGVRPCVNPAHLEPVSHAENVRRGKVAKLSMPIARALRDQFVLYDGPVGAFFQHWGDALGVTKGAIDHIINQRTWVEER